MKWFVALILLVLVGFVANSQTLLPANPIPTQYSTGFFIHGWHKADSGHISAVRDTSLAPRYAGTRIMWQRAGVDTAEWFFTGHRWVQNSVGTFSNQNISNSALTWNGNYTQNVNHRNLFFDSSNQWRISSIENDFSLPRKTRMEINATRGAFSNFTTGGPFFLFSLRRADGIIDSIINSYGFQTGGINILSTESTTTTVKSAEIVASTKDSILVRLTATSSGGPGSILTLDKRNIKLSPNDTLFMKAKAASTADSLLGIKTTAGGVDMIVKVPVTSGDGLTSVGVSLPSAFTVLNSPLTSNGVLNVIGAGTALQYVRGNGTLATFDTTAIPTFSEKVRGLFSGTSPIVYSNGQISILNATASGQKGAATFNNSDFSDNGSGTISLSSLVTAGSCTGCALNIGADGRITSYSTGAGGATNNTNIGSGLRPVNEGTQAMRTYFGGFGTIIDSVTNTNGLTWSSDTTRVTGLPTYWYVDSAVAAGGGSGGGNTNSNIGTGYRWAIPNTNDIKSSIAGFGILQDSTAVSNTIRTQIDTSVIATQHDISLLPQPTTITENKSYYHTEQYVNHRVDTDGSIVADTSVNITDYMPINANESVTIKSSIGANIAVYGWTYDSDLNPISEIRSSGLIGTLIPTYTFTTPANAAYINIYCKITDNNFYQFLRIESTNPITYTAPVTPEQFSGANASIKIQKALDFARFTSSYVELKGYYRIDSTIIMSSANTLVLNNAHVQLDSSLENNFIRNEAQKYAYPNNFPRGNKYIKIIGVGNALLEGSYANWGGASPGWMAWGIQLTNVEDFVIDGIQMKATHGNCIDLVQSRIGLLHNIEFIESGEQLNQGGIEVIRASNRITVENVWGRCQDDFVTIGNLAYTDSFHTDGPNLLDPYATNWDVYDVIIKNVHREPAGIFFFDPEPFWKGGVRLLSADSFNIRDCTLDGITGVQNIYLQDPTDFYGVSTINNMYNITITNTDAPIWISKPVKNCSFINIAKYDTSGTFQSAVPPDSSLNITRKYYDESLEYNAFVSVTDWVIQADQFGTNGSDIIKTGAVNNALRVVVKNNTAGANAQAAFRAINDQGYSLISGMYSSATTPLGAIAANGAFTFSSAAGGYALVQGEPGTAIKFAAGGTTEQMRIMSTGVGIGETTPADALHITNFNGSLGQGSTIRLQQSSSDANRGNLDFYTSGGTPSSPTAVSDGRIVAVIRGYEHDGSSYLVNASMMFVADGTPSTGLTPGSVVFSTRDASGNFNENMRISADRSITMQSLAGVGSRMVTADANGILGTQAIPSAATTIYNGDGSITGGNRTVTLGSNNLTLNASSSGDLVFSLGSDANYDMFYRNSSGSIDRLAAGTDGQVLTTHGTGSAPTWETASGGTTLYSGDGTVAGNRIVTGSNNDLTFATIDVFRVNANLFTQSKNNGTRPYSSMIGATSRESWQFAYDAFNRGVGLYVDTLNNVGVGDNSLTTMPLYNRGNSALINGLQSLKGNFYQVTNVTSSATASIESYFYVIDATAGSITITLPAASAAFGGGMGIQYVFKRIDNSGNTVTIQRAGSDTIDGGTSFTLNAQWDKAVVQCASTSTWLIINQ